MAGAVFPSAIGGSTLPISTIIWEDVGRDLHWNAKLITESVNRVISVWPEEKPKGTSAQPRRPDTRYYRWHSCLSRRGLRENGKKVHHCVHEDSSRGLDRGGYAMSKIFDCDQGSDEWHRLRCGIPTASEFSTVLAKG